MGSTWLSTGVVSLGVLFDHDQIIKGGIAFFILIPFVRVIGLLISFAKNRDHAMTIVASAVMIIIISSFLTGLEH